MALTLRNESDRGGADGKWGKMAETGEKRARTFVRY